MRRLLLLFPLLAAFACRGPEYSKQERELLQNHLVAFDSDGHPLNPNSYMRGWFLGDQNLTPLDYQQRLRSITLAAQKYFDDDPCSDGEERILLFVHGGLNTYEASIRRVLETAPRIKQSGYYPIFVAWNSDLFSSYGHHLTHDEGTASVLRTVSSPLLVLKDLVLGVMNLPVRTVNFMTDTAGAFREGEHRRAREAASQASGVEAQYRLAVDERSRLARQEERDPTASVRATPLDVVIPVQIGGFQQDGFQDWYRYSNLSAKYVLGPVSMTMSFFIDSFGKRSWEGMLLRTKLLFDDAEHRERVEAHNAHGVSALLHELHELQTSYPDATQRGLSALGAGLERILQKIDDPKYRPLFDRLMEALNDDHGKLKRSTALIQAVGSAFGASPETDPGAGHAQDGTRLLSRSDSGFEELIQLLGLLALDPSDSRQVLRISEAITALRNHDDKMRASGFEDWYRNLLDDSRDKLTREKIASHARLLKHLVDKALVNVRRDEIQIDLFAHSMGCIVANEMLKRSAWDPVPRFKNIVYMAAACSIRDYEESTFPYLKRHKEYGSNLYNLMLHPEAETEENMFYDLIPRGSLLVYIDNYLTQPATLRDKTAGQFQNIFRAIHGTRPEVADQIHLRVFPAGQGRRDREPWERAELPEGHGEFTPLDFWDTDFWEVPSVTPAAREETKSLQKTEEPPPQT